MKIRHVVEDCHSEPAGAPPRLTDGRSTRASGRRTARNLLPISSAAALTRFQEGDSSPRFAPEPALRERQASGGGLRRLGMTAMCMLAAVITLSARAQDIVIRDATILTITHGKIEHGSILIHAGKIAAVDANDRVTAPANATVIDAAGKFVMPGIIDTHSHSAVEGSVNEISLPNSGMVRIGDVLSNEDSDVYRQLAGGTTTALVLHGSANPIGGQSQIVKWKW